MEGGLPRQRLPNTKLQTHQRGEVHRTATAFEYAPNLVPLNDNYRFKVDRVNGVQ